MTDAAPLLPAQICAGRSVRAVFESESVTGIVVDDHCLLIVIDVKGERLNVLTHSLGDELNDLIAKAKQWTGVLFGVIVSGKEVGFIAGADIKMEYMFVREEQCTEAVKKGKDIMSQLESLPFPTLALISGDCLGGGLELALACTFRICVKGGQGEKHKIGLPEVKLGLLPALKGLSRLPHVVGFFDALMMTVKGEAISQARAVAIGLVDAVLTAPAAVELVGALLKQTRKDGVTKAVRQLKAKQKSGKGRTIAAKMCNSSAFLRGLACDVVREEAAKTTLKRFPAPPIIAELCLQSSSTPLSGGELSPSILKDETAAFSRLAVTPEAKALCGLFLQQRALKKKVESNIASMDGGLRKVMVVVRSMGEAIDGGPTVYVDPLRGLVQALVLAGVETTVVADANATKVMVEKGIDELCKYAVRKRVVSGEAMDEARARLAFALVSDGAIEKNFDCVIEASNCYDSDQASISVGMISRVFKPSRKIPMFFCSFSLSPEDLTLFDGSTYVYGIMTTGVPMHKYPFLEVSCLSSARSCLPVAKEVSKAVGKMFVPSINGHGTITSRLLGSMFGSVAIAVAKCMEASVSASVACRAADKVCKKIWGRKEGVLLAMDTVGIPAVRAMLVRETRLLRTMKREEDAGLVAKFVLRVIEHCLLEMGRTGTPAGGGFFDLGGNMIDVMGATEAIEENTREEDVDVVDEMWTALCRGALHTMSKLDEWMSEEDWHAMVDLVAVGGYAQLPAHTGGPVQFVDFCRSLRPSSMPPLFSSLVSHAPLLYTSRPVPTQHFYSDPFSYPSGDLAPTRSLIVRVAIAVCVGVALLLALLISKSI
uniref:Enoyl-CoA hydratase n=1 Tax=Palpitomonas bilix TaxID=652834 RepID=A0A7S3D3X7_9EUKA|mmetsp:Transcript_20307/g.51992  ORF Transcript_20307/g.51992 Transcript_20307/m.51992 type:complete len:826 (+) Transcript_20307:175-2652(+)